MLATSSNDLLNFLNSDNDIRPTRELMKKRLTPHMASSMEGLLTEEELEFALFFKMKGSSSPGLDGFTVNHLRTFWYDLKAVIKDGQNCMIRDKCTSTLRTAGFICARKGAFHSYNGNLGFDCCIQTSADESTALSLTNPVLISWTCPVCDLTVSPGCGAANGRTA